MTNMNTNPLRPSKEEIIWRYIGLDKLIDLLITKTLKFTVVSIASDKNELQWILKSLKDSPEYDKHNEGASFHINWLRNTTYISCWTMKETESRSLWATYLGFDKIGVAIKSTVGNFIDSLNWNNYGFDYRIVDYRNNFNFEEIQSNIIVTNTKNTAYKEESEIRFYVTHKDLINYDKLVINDNPKDKVISFEVDLSHLIQELMISPYCAKWQRDNIIRLVEKYQPNLTNKISESTIYE
ncbi:hypothetical protein [Algoriphagus vanfongensis]|uniref:hypothetical protein n=1 Tax=Algoriphagus vanfongensis TaxID=426371 RepID=UPI000416A3D2|nr:hypothetical protein [Algoriphagus vanfongensis]